MSMHFDVDDTHYLAHVLHMGEHYLQMVTCAVCSMFGSSATPWQASRMEEPIALWHAEV